MGGTHRYPLQPDSGNNLAPQSQLRRLLPEKSRSAAVSVAEAEIVARHQPPGPVYLGQHDHKVLPRHRHHGPVEGHGDDLHPREQRPGRAAPLLNGGQQGHRRAGNKFPRGAVKGQQRGGKSQHPRPLRRPAQQGLMAQMNAVKKAKGDSPLPALFHCTPSLWPAYFSRRKNS